MIKKTYLKIAAVPAFVAGAALVPISAAHAALPSGVTDAIETVGNDLETAAGAVIAALVAFWGLRKLGQKMGWW